MQTRATVGVIAAALVALLLGGCASGGGLFRDRDDRDEAARLLIEREADKERALLEAEAEAEAARREKDERAEKAQREADEDAERRKREEAADSEQERRHRRELKEAEHDAKIRELHRGSRAPAPEVERHQIALEKAAAADTERAHELSYCAHSSGTYKQFDECRNERVHRLELKARATDSDVTKMFGLLPHSAADAYISGDATRGEWEAVKRAVVAEDVANQAYNDAGRAFFAAAHASDDALRRWHAAPGESFLAAAHASDDALRNHWRPDPSHSDADEAAAFLAARRRADAAEKHLLGKIRAWADAQVTTADAMRALAVKTRAALEADPAALDSACRDALCAATVNEVVEVAEQIIAEVQRAETTADAIEAAEQIIAEMQRAETETTNAAAQNAQPESGVQCWIDAAPSHSRRQCVVMQDRGRSVVYPGRVAPSVQTQEQRRAPPKKRRGPRKPARPSFR